MAEKAPVENPPGYVFDNAFWERLKKDEAVEECELKKGDLVEPLSAGEIYFVRAGVVAADFPRRRLTAQRLLFTRGMHFHPNVEEDKPAFKALTNVSAYRLFVSRLETDDARTVTDCLGNLDALGPRLLDTVKALFAQSEFGNLSTKIVLDLVKTEGVAIVIEKGGRRDLEDGFVYVATGEAKDLAPAQRDCRRLWEGSVHQGKFSLASEQGCVLVHLPAAGIARFRRSSPALRRALKQRGDDCLPHVQGGREHLPQFVLLATAGVEAPLEELNYLLAETVAEDFKSKTLVLTVTAGDAAMTSPRPAGPGKSGSFVGSVGIKSFLYNHPLFQREGYDCVFLSVPPDLIVEGCSLVTGWADATEPPGDRRPDGRKTGAPLTTLVFVTDPFVDLPGNLALLRDNRQQRVMLLGGDLGDEDPAYLPRTIRLRVNLDEIRHLAGLRLADVPLLVRKALSRLARAATDRQVGLALSGGGAWVFAHLALIEAMHRAKIPIDLVSGASGGSLVGAYYCAFGLPGLARLRDAAGRMDLALLFAMCSTRPLEWSVQLDLEGRRLRDLDVPLYPIVADLTNAVEFVPRRGGLSVAECVRASSTLVPLVASTNFEGRRVADGVFVNNTGERVLAEEGADLLIASDCVQTPDEAPPGGLLDFMYRIRRIRDAMDSNHLLVKSSDAADSFLADCTFDPTNLATGPVGFASGRANERVAKHQAEHFVRTQVQPLWDRLRAP